MKKIFFAIPVILFFAAASGQSLSKLTLSDKGTLDVISFEIDDNVTLSVTETGNIIEFGIELYRDRVEYFNRKPEPYTGRVEYYTPNDNEAFRGKIKYIGKTLITYYASYDEDALKGKIKTIGSTPIEYYASYDDKAYTGKIKNAGPIAFTYYSSFSNDAYKGKLQTVGSTAFSYFAAFDDKAYAGKIKSIGDASFTYYSSYDFQKEYRGLMKSGSRIQTINGIKFYIKG